MPSAKVVLITGATGFVGRHLAQALAARGDVVRGVSRSPREPEPGGVSQWFLWGSPQEAIPAAAVEGADVVIHLAGESVAGRWNREKKAKIRSSRVEGTARVVEAIVAQIAVASADTKESRAPAALISASAIGYYGDRGDDTLAEDAGSDPEDFLAEVCRAWEDEAVKAEGHDVRVAIPRIGLVMHPDGGALEAMLTPFKMGVGGKLGSGKQWQSWIHLEDLIKALMFAVDETSLTGRFNATAPNPVRQKEFAKTLAGVLGRPSFLPAPAFALKAILGEFATELLSSKRVVPTALNAAGFNFAFPDLKGALTSLMA